MSDVNEILQIMGPLEKEKEDLVKKAYRFAEKAYEGKKRYSGEPYFIHAFETARILAEFGMGPKTICAGLLHDALEDGGATQEELLDAFGKEIFFLIEGVTKLGSLKYRGMERHAESLRKLLVATSQDVRVLIIKLADRLHNMRTLQYVPEKKQKRIAMETLEIYAPIADRLNMGKFYAELTDLAFPYIYQNEYAETKELMKQKGKETLEHLEKVRKSLVKELAVQGVTGFRTDYRIKSLYSLWRKLQRKGMDIEKIHDISALRIIVPTVNDCYRVLGIVHGLWRPLPGKIKDYIAFEKPNGYKSLHTTIFTGDGGIVEIQIRTEEMHREAEYGIASHAQYKAKAEVRAGTANPLAWFRQFFPVSAPSHNKTLLDQPKQYHPIEVPVWVKQLAEAQQGLEKSEDFLENLKADFFSHRIFVFTPLGDVIDLPINSTPIDFAYAIHSDVGDHTFGAKINGKFAALDDALQNGDIVEILTKKGSKPSKKWLEIAKTTMARRHIRTALMKH
jgi:guanosine-3',5'-bis(diphosphate) 3'-pyrophosphohydrolase